MLHSPFFRKYTTVGYIPPLCVFEQEGRQFFRDKHRPCLGFAGDFSQAGADSLHGDKPQFRHPDPYGAYRLDHMVQLFFTIDCQILQLMRWVKGRVCVLASPSRPGYDENGGECDQE